MQEVNITDAGPREIAETALEIFRDDGTVTITVPEGNSFRSHTPSEYDAPYMIEDADNGVKIVSEDNATITIPVRKGSSLLGRTA